MFLKSGVIPTTSSILNGSYSMPIAAKQYNPEKGKAEYYEWVAKYHAANQKKEIVYPPIWEGEDDDEEEEEEKEIKKETKKSDQNKKRKREENHHNQNDKDDGNDNQMNQKDDKKMKTINKGRTSGRTTRASSRFKSE